MNSTTKSAQKKPPAGASKKPTLSSKKSNSTKFSKYKVNYHVWGFFLELRG